MTVSTAAPTSSFTMKRAFDADFTVTLEATRAALATQGFGVITEIDMAATLRAKLGVEVADQVILGACRPELAHRATEVAPEVATVLPCNVVVRSIASENEASPRSVVEMFDPAAIIALTGTSATENPTTESDLVEVAADARRRLAAALHAIDPGSS